VFHREKIHNVWIVQEEDGAREIGSRIRCADQKELRAQPQQSRGERPCAGAGAGGLTKIGRARRLSFVVRSTNRAQPTLFCVKCAKGQQ